VNPTQVRVRTVITVAVCLAVHACGGESPDAAPLGTFSTITSPAAPGSAQPNLFVAGNRVVLSWLEPQGGKTYALRFAQREGEEWTEPRTVAEGDNYFVNWADFPSVIGLPDGSLAAHWLVRSGPSAYAYDVHIARSMDRGKTWSESVIPHRDSTQTEHGFVSLFPWMDDRLAAVWLDGRNYAKAEGADGEHGDAEMTLHHAVLARDGEIGSEALLDPRTCDCCQTAAAQTFMGPVVVYRDRSEDEIRDIAIVRVIGGQWTEPRLVHADQWKIAACPVNGPAISADGEKVAVAWFTAAQDTPRVRVAFSDDAGATFGQPVTVDGGDPTGRVGAELLPDGSVLVSWLETVGEGAEVRVRRVRPDGTMSAHQTVATSSAARASGFPRMARIGNEIIFAWTEPGDPTQVKVSSAKLGRL
jgi:hypothetical protein